VILYFVTTGTIRYLALW